MSSKAKDGTVSLSRSRPRTNNPYKCEDCGYTTLYNLEMKDHIATTECYPYRCGICGLKLRRASNLYTHNKKIHEGITEELPLSREPSRKRYNRSYECADCGYKTEYQYQFEHHIVSNPQCKAYKCEICGVGIRRKNSLYVHMKTHTGAMDYPCRYCDQKFRTTSHRKLHEDIHEGNLNFNCEFCDRRFVQRGSYVTHMNSFHPTEEVVDKETDRSNKFVCEICGRGLKRERFLKSHVAKHKWGDKLNFCCQYCNRKFYTNIQLTNHIHDYHTEKVKEAMRNGVLGPRKIRTALCHSKNRLECKKCDARFREKGEFMKHIQLKHDEYFKEGCPFCPETAFKSDEQLYEHYDKIHTADRPYKCKYCPKTFTLERITEEHELRRHTGTKSVECSVCKIMLTTINYERGGHKERCQLVDGKINCEVCNEDIEQTKFRDHYSLHENPLPFHCMHCESIFETRAELDSHLQEHNEKDLLPVAVDKNDCYPFKCHLCQISFRTFRLLRNHLINHSEKKFSCFICRHYYKSEAQLTIHRTKYHGDERNYNCPICSSAFIDPKNFYRHVRNNHGLVTAKLKKKCTRKYAHFKVLPKEFELPEDGEIEEGASSSEESEASGNDDTFDESDFDESNLTEASEPSESDTDENYEIPGPSNAQIKKPDRFPKRKTIETMHDIFKKSRRQKDVTSVPEPVALTQEDVKESVQSQIIVPEVCESTEDTMEEHVKEEIKTEDKVMIPIVPLVDTQLPSGNSVKDELKTEEDDLKYSEVMKESDFKRRKLSTSKNTSGTQRPNVFSIFQTRKRKTVVKREIVLQEDSTVSGRSVTDNKVKSEEPDSIDSNGRIECTALPLTAAIYQAAAVRKNEMMVVFAKDISVDLLQTVQQNASSCILCVEENDDRMESEDILAILKTYDANEAYITILKENDECGRWTIISFGPDTLPTDLKSKLFRSFTELENVFEDYCTSLGLGLRIMMRHSIEDSSTNLMAQFKKKITCCNYAK